MERRGPGLWPGRPNPPTMARARTTFAMLRLAGAPARDGGGPARHPLGRHPEPPEDRALDDTGSQPGCQGLDQAERNVALWQADGHGTVLCALAARPLRRMPRLGFRGCSTTIAGSAAHRSMPAKPTRRDRPLLDRRWEQPILSRWRPFAIRSMAKCRGKHRLNALSVFSGRPGKSSGRGRKSQRGRASTTTCWKPGSMNSTAIRMLPFRRSPAARSRCLARSLPPLRQQKGFARRGLG